jgi:hypothetical protein
LSRFLFLGTQGTGECLEWVIWDSNQCRKVRVVVKFPVEATNIAVHLNVHTGSKNQAVSYKATRKVLFSKNKASGAWTGHSPLFSAEFINSWSHT